MWKPGMSKTIYGIIVLSCIHEKRFRVKICIKKKKIFSIHPDIILFGVYENPLKYLIIAVDYMAVSFLKSPARIWVTGLLSIRNALANLLRVRSKFSIYKPNHRSIFILVGLFFLRYLFIYRQSPEQVPWTQIWMPKSWEPRQSGVNSYLSLQ